VKHRAMTSAVFELIQTFEFDMTLGDESWPTRVELHQATQGKGGRHVDSDTILRWLCLRSHPLRVLGAATRHGQLPLP
jgi:hypothetical protein